RLAGPPAERHRAPDHADAVSLLRPTDNPGVGRTVTLHVQEFAGPSAEWDRFVRAQPQWTHCHLFGWKTVMTRALGHECFLLAARDPDRGLAGVLPLVRVNSLLFGHYLVSMPFLNYGGPLGSAAGVQALVAHATGLAQRDRVKPLELRSRRPPRRGRLRAALGGGGRGHLGLACRQRSRAPTQCAALLVLHRARGPRGGAHLQLWALDAGLRPARVQASLGRAGRAALVVRPRLPERYDDAVAARSRAGLVPSPLEADTRTPSQPARTAHRAVPPVNARAAHRA